MIDLSLKKRIIVASGKGGVGKSTLSAHLAVALSKLGNRVLLIDCDMENRCLDLIFAVEDTIAFDIHDVISGHCPPSEAVKKLDERLFFVPAPPVGSLSCQDDELIGTIKLITKETDPEYVIYDTGAGTRLPLLLADSAADSAVIVATQSPMSIRAADGIADLLYEKGLEDLTLAIQNFHIKKAANGELDSINAMIDKTRLRLIGVIPYSHKLAVSGIAAPRDISDVSRAADNIALRLTGQSVPLFTAMKAAKGRTKVY